MDWLPPLLASVASAVILAVPAAFLWRRLRRNWRASEVLKAVNSFRLQREQLEAKFFDLAASKGKPRGLRWLDCEWQDAVLFARDIHTGLLTAFVAVNIRFEAIEGGDMEDVEAVATVRDAAALFHYERGTWGTGGRALFNMNPQDALTRLEGQYQPLSADLTSAFRR